MCKLVVIGSLLGALALPARAFQPVLLPDHPLSADGSVVHTLALYLVEGDHLAHGAVEVKAAHGQLLGPAEPAEDGGYRVRYRPRKVAGPSGDTLTVSEGGERHACRIALAPAGRVQVALAIHPDPLLLGKGASAEVRVRVRDASGQPARAPLRVSASVGRLGPLVELEPGEYRATYTPPPERFPQVAIVAVLSIADGAFAAAPLKLAARVTVTGEGEPGASMRILVDGRSFGPTPIGPDGRFALPLVVPPGGRAIGISTDRAGNEVRRPVDLRLPPFPRLLLAAVPSELPADGRARAEVVAFAVDARGGPVRLRAPVLSADRGTLSSGEPRGDGTFHFTFTAPDRRDSRVARLRSGKDEARIALRAAPPFHLKMIALPEPLAAGVSSPQSIEVQLEDGADEPVPGARLQATLQGGRVLGIDERPNGRYRIRVETPRDPSLSSTALHVELDGLSPGAPRRITLHRARAPSGRIAAEAWLDDDLGLPVPGVAVTLAGPGGSVETKSDRYGTARIELAPPSAARFEIVAHAAALPGLEATLDELRIGSEWIAVASERGTGLLDETEAPPGASLDAEVPLQPGSPIDLRLTASSVVHAGQPLAVQVALVGTKKGAIVYQASAGRLELVQPLAGGHALLRFTPPAGARPGDRFVLSVTEVKGRVTAFVQVVAK